MNITVEVKGLQGVEDALAEAGPKLARKVVRKGLTAAGDVMVGAVKNLAPVAQEGTPQRRPGELRDSITKKIKMSPKEEAGYVIVGPEYKKADGNQSPGVYGSFVEFGSVHNPKIQPFMRPGFDEAKQAALDAFTEIVKDGVDSLK